jgi:site-specific DNA-methyltransferase (adenine-specific)
MLAKIIKATGWRKPITVSTLSGYITAGHGRLHAAQHKGWAEVPIDYQGYDSEEQELADVLADNAIAELAEYDFSVLEDDLRLLATQEFDLELTGISEEELDELLKEADGGGAGSDVPPQLDRADELRDKWEVDNGQIWELGGHLLLCGDCTVSHNIEKILGKSNVDLVVTDPPYGVSYADKNAMLNRLDNGNRIQKTINNDHLSVDETRKLWTSAWKMTRPFLADHCVYYITGPQGGDLLLNLFRSLEDGGLPLRHMLIWVKNNHVLGRCDYHYKHEPILYGWVKTHRFMGDRSNNSVWEIDKPQRSEYHPTTKPVELYMRAIRNSSKRKEIVYEPFCGSGTAIIACEQLGRCCRAIEIDPGYVAVALQRWADMTGQTPKLKSD